ncbi:hypothetical protein BGZ93_007198 [Podila epicladia]|nr:hypothetical protein BGZ93_007198 [Podila epicladia]
MSLPRFLRGFNKSKSSSSSTHLGHNQVASDLNLSDASSSSSSSGPKDALGQPLPVSTIVISSKKPASVSLTTPGLDIISESQPISPSGSSASASTSTDDPGSQDTLLASVDLSIPSSKNNSRSSSRSRSSTGSIAVPIPIKSSNKHRSRRSSHYEDDEDTNNPPESSLLSTSCPNFTSTTFSDSVPTPPIPTVHITSPRPPRPSYPLPPIPAEETDVSSLSSSLSTSASATPRRVRSNALSVLSDSELSLNSGTLGNSLDVETETFSRPSQDQTSKFDKDDHHVDDKGVTAADGTTRTTTTPRSRSLSASTTTDSTSTTSRPVSILKKPRSILRSRSGSYPLLPEPMTRTGSGSDSLIPAFPAPPSTSRHSGSSDTSLVSTSASWYLQHDPTAMARRDEGPRGPEAVPMPRIRRSNSHSHSQRRLSGRDQDLKEQGKRS